VTRALVFLAVIGAATVGSWIALALGERDWLTWLLAVVGPLGLAAALAELREARDA
jgi:hypothetical protein